jgi:pimeloyl-ACP methyl ester carboxylesterase
MASQFLSPKPAAHRKRPLWRRLASLAAALVVLWLLGSGVATFLFTRRLSGPTPEALPHVGWGDLEALRLKTGDGQDLGAWVNARGDKPSVVLLLHGIGDTRTWWLPVMQRLAGYGYASMAVSFRAHGDSTGSIEDFGYSERDDVIAAVRYLRGRFPNRSIALVGSSLGSAAAVFAAKALGHEVAGYFLESPYRDLRTAAWNRVGAFPTPLDWLTYEGMSLWGRVLLPESPDVIRPIGHVADIPTDVPVTFVAARGDRNCKPEEVEALYQKIASHARLVVIDDAAHGWCSRLRPIEYDAALLELLRRTDRGGTKEKLADTLRVPPPDPPSTCQL